MRSLPKYAYALTAEQAVKKVCGHVDEVRKQLPKKPLHEIPLELIIAKTRETLAKHPDFKVSAGTHRMLRTTSLGGVELYCNYEIGHRLLVDQTLSKIRQTFDRF